MSGNVGNSGVGAAVESDALAVIAAVVAVLGLVAPGEGNIVVGVVVTAATLRSVEVVNVALDDTESTLRPTHLAPIVDDAPFAKTQSSTEQKALRGEHCAITREVSPQKLGHTVVLLGTVVVPTDVTSMPPIDVQRAPTAPSIAQISTLQIALREEHCVTTVLRFVEQTFGQTIVSCAPKFRLAH